MSPVRAREAPRATVGDAARADLLRIESEFVTAASVESVLAEYGVYPEGDVAELTWHKVIGPSEEKRWLRADTGGLVDMEWGPYPLVEEGETICTISDHFRREERLVTAPFTGLVLGVLENPVAAPGHPLCHLVRIDRETRVEIEREIERGEFDGYRMRGLGWR